MVGYMGTTIYIIIVSPDCLETTLRAFGARVTSIIIHVPRSYLIMLCEIIRMHSEHNRNTALVMTMFIVYVYLTSS